MQTIDNAQPQPTASDDEAERLKLLGNAGEGQRLVEQLITSGRKFVKVPKDDSKSATSAAQNVRNYLRSEEGQEHKDRVAVNKHDKIVTLVNLDLASEEVKKALAARKRGAS